MEVYWQTANAMHGTSKSHAGIRECLSGANLHQTGLMAGKYMRQEARTLLNRNKVDPLDVYDTVPRIEEEPFVTCLQ